MTRQRRKKVQNVDIRDHPRFTDDLSDRERHTLKQELLTLRRAPNAIQKQKGDTKYSRVKRLQNIAWSWKSIEKVTGVSRKQQAVWRKGAQRQSETPELVLQVLNDNLLPELSRHALPKKLPNELLHRIFSFLPVKDVLSLRQTCSTMASVGLEHSRPEVTLISLHDSFRNLVKVATHPEVSKGVRSLFYICDRLEFDAQELEQTRSDSKLALERQVYELDSLRVLCLECPRLREVTIASGEGCGRRPQGFMAAVKSLGTERHMRSLDWRHTGVRQILNLADAVTSAGLRLDSLTISETTHRLWDCHSENDRLNLEALIRPLRRFRLFVKARRKPLTDGNSDDDSEADFDIKNYQAGRFRAMLSEATNLRVLKLQFPSFQPYCNSFQSPNLEDLLGDLKFPHLYEFAISRCATNSSFLKSVILRHRATLRRLTISRIHLVGDDFEDFVKSIAGQLPDLCEVTLRGVSTPGPWSPEYCNGTYFIREYPEKTMGRYHAERFVLMGGVAPDWGDWRYEEMKKYVQPRRGTKPLRPDDPKWDYDWDEFDERILPPRKRYAW